MGLVDLLAFVLLIQLLVSVERREEEVLELLLLVGQHEVNTLRDVVFGLEGDGLDSTTLHPGLGFVVAHQSFLGVFVKQVGSQFSYEDAFLKFKFASVSR